MVSRWVPHSSSSSSKMSSQSELYKEMQFFVEYLLAISSWLLFNVCDYWSWMHIWDRRLWTVSVWDYSWSKICWVPEKGDLQFSTPRVQLLRVFTINSIFLLHRPALITIAWPVCCVCRLHDTVLFNLQLVLLANGVFQLRFGRFTWYQMKFLTLSFQISATQRNYLYCVNLVIPRRRRKSWRKWKRMIWRWRVLC